MAPPHHHLLEQPVPGPRRTPRLGAELALIRAKWGGQVAAESRLTFPRGGGGFCNRANVISMVEP